MRDEKLFQVVQHIRQFAMNEITYLIDKELEYLSNCWVDADVETFTTLQGEAKALRKLKYKIARPILDTRQGGTDE